MPYELRYIYLPYCIQRQKDGSYIVLNRDYKPLGIKPTELVDYESYPIKVKLRGLGAATAAKISWKGSRELSAIYLYNDGCVPTSSNANMTAYLARLARFAKLRVD
jgi:hypothetical protein